MDFTQGMGETIETLREAIGRDEIKWGIGFITLGVLFYTLFASIIAKVPAFSSGEKPNTQGKIISVALMILSMISLYGGEKAGLFGTLKGQAGTTFTIAGAVAAFLVIGRVKKGLATSRFEIIANNATFIAMLFTAGLTFFVAQLLESTELFIVAAVLVIGSFVIYGLKIGYENLENKKMRSNEKEREKMENRRRKEEKRVRKEQIKERKLDIEVMNMENYMRKNIIEQEGAVEKEIANTEREEDAIIQRVYGYLRVLDANEDKIKKVDKYVARGYANLVPRAEYFKQIKQRYAQAAKDELKRLSELLIKESSLKEKQESLVEGERKELEQEAKNLMQELKGERRDIILERREIMQTIEEVEKAESRGEIRRIRKEQEIHNRILADLIKKRYAAKKEHDLMKRYGKIFRYDQNELKKINLLIDMTDYGKAEKELRKLLYKVRDEEEKIIEFDKKQKQKTAETEDIIQKEDESQKLERKEIKAAKKEISAA
jgi:gamma-glutamylcyclotransferase (GGCT)/AIG2-like uncharacterized protein YtfP